MDEYSIEQVWPAPDQKTRNDVIAFWRTETDLAEGRLVERSRQLVDVCRTSSGAVAAVSTAFPFHVPTLGFPCFFVRALVGKQHRVRGLRRTKVIEDLLNATYATLDDRFQQGHNPDVLGVYLEIENTKLRRRRRELVWKAPDCQFVFIGELSNGRHARVCYFTNAIKCP